MKLPLRLGDEAIKFVVPGAVAALGATLAAPILLAALVKIARPVVKEAIRLYLDLAHDLQEVVAQHRVRLEKASRFSSHLLSGVSEKLVTDELESETEEILGETLLEGIMEIL
jgi:hypothetical protein